MRIIAGEARGRRLKTRRGTDTRPTADMVKESLFNILSLKTAGSTFLDVYAGNGGVGIEALSRGAHKCVFIEKNKLCVKIIWDNLILTGYSERSRIMPTDAKTALTALQENSSFFDLIFFDPPYFSRDLPGALQLGALVLAPEGLVIVEHHKRDFSWRDDAVWTVAKERYFGDTALSFLSKKVTVDK